MCLIIEGENMNVAMGDSDSEALQVTVSIVSRLAYSNIYYTIGLQYCIITVANSAVLMVIYGYIRSSANLPIMVILLDWEYQC